MLKKNTYDEFTLERKPCCARLRCKSMYYRADERPGLLHAEESMGYWCGETNGDLGPDEKLATHKACQPGRVCFVAGPRTGRGEG